MSRASVVIPLFNQAELTRACLAALEAAGLDGVELVLVDNASTDGTAALLDEWAGSARVIRNPVNLGFAPACNQGAAAAAAPVVVLLNNDTEVHPGWLEPLLDAVEDPGVGVAGSLLLYPDGRVQHAGMAVLPGLQPAHVHRHLHGGDPVVRRDRDMVLVTGACMAVRRGRLLDAGGLDEGYRNGYEDVDLCLRLASQGLRARYCAGSVVTHHEGMSAGRTDREAANAARFRRRWLGWPADWDERMAEDGVPEMGLARCTWFGPLFDGSPEAALGVAAVQALHDDGLRPLAVEVPKRPLGPASHCPPAVLAALNRVHPGPALPRAFVHVDALARDLRGMREDEVVVVTGPGPAPDRPLPRRATLALGGDDADPAALPAASEAVLGPPDRGVALGWWGPMLGRSGYAAAARGLLAAATREGWRVRVEPADRPADGEAPPLPELGPQGFAPSVLVAHHIPVTPQGERVWDLLAERGKVTIGATCFEAAGIPPSWVDACGRMRQVWVPTAFNMRTFAAAGVDRGLLRAVPYPVDGRVFAPGPRRPRAEVTTFVSVFEWTWRKGWDVLLRAYVEEFAPSEPVRLLVLTYRGAGTAGDRPIVDQAMDLLGRMGRTGDDVPDIELMLEPVSTAGLIELYRGADAFVLPTRGEGAGMPVLEAMACGTPVIATAFGGHEEVMDPELAFPVAVRAMVPADPALVADNALYAGMTLAEPDPASLRAAMRAVVEDPDGAAARARRARELVADRFGIAAAGRAMRDALEEVARHPGRAPR